MASSNLILLVEDSPDDERLTLRALSEMSPAPDVQVARTIDEANRILFERGRCSLPPDLILLDWSLPQGDGKQVLTSVGSCKFSKHVPVIVFSSACEESVQAQALQLGGDEFVSKPMSGDDYLSTVQGIVSRWLGRSSPMAAGNGNPLI